MASIRKRGDKWEVRIVRKGEGSACKSFSLKGDAEKYARQVEAAMDRGEWLRPQSNDKATPTVEVASCAILESNWIE